MAPGRQGAEWTHVYSSKLFWWLHEGLADFVFVLVFNLACANTFWRLQSKWRITRTNMGTDVLVSKYDVSKCLCSISVLLCLRPVTCSSSTGTNLHTMLWVAPRQNTGVPGTMWHLRYLLNMYLLIEEICAVYITYMYALSLYMICSHQT